MAVHGPGAVRRAPPLDQTLAGRAFRSLVGVVLLLSLTGCSVGLEQLSPEIDDIISRFKARQGPLDCGTWRHGFAESQRQTLQSIPPGDTASDLEAGGERPAALDKLVVYDCYGEGGLHHYSCGGLGDVLRGVAGATALAAMMNRPLLLRTPLLELGLDPSEVDWRMPESIGKLLPDFKANSSRRIFIHPQSGSNKLSPAFSVDLMALSPQGNFQVYQSLFNMNKLEGVVGTVLIRGHRGVLSHLLNQNGKGAAETQEWWQERGITDAAVLQACILRMLFQPKASVVARFSHFFERLQEPGTLSVGLHIRTGDESLNAIEEASPGQAKEEFSKHRILVRCAQIITSYKVRGEDAGAENGHLSPITPSAPRKVVWFVASDSFALKQELLRQFPSQVMLAEVQPRHVSVKDQPNSYKDMEAFRQVVEDTLGEWCLFAQCQNHVFRLSGWSYMAALFSTTLNGTDDVMYARSWTSDPPDGGGCELHHPVHWVQRAWNWGGI